MNSVASRREYFVYKGVMYGIGTKVLLSDAGCKKHYITLHNKDKPLTYGFTCGGRNLFGWTDPRGRKYGYSDASIYDCDLENDIQSIVDPVYVELVSLWEKAIDNMVNKKVSPDVFGGVLLYTIIMVVGAIFVDRFLIWVFATVIFVGWLLNQYRT